MLCSHWIHTHTHTHHIHLTILSRTNCSKFGFFAIIRCFFLVFCFLFFSFLFPMIIGEGANNHSSRWFASIWILPHIPWQLGKYSGLLLGVCNWLAVQLLCLWIYPLICTDVMLSVAAPNHWAQLEVLMQAFCCFMCDSPDGRLA